MQYYHGTSDIFKITKLLPPVETGILREQWRTKLTNKVFFTNSQMSAAKYAKKAAEKYGGNPIIYEVNPIGPIWNTNTNEYVADFATIVQSIPYKTKETQVKQQEKGTYTMEQKKNPFAVLDDLSQDERCELWGRLIDVVEDWLTEKGITPEDIPNPERDEYNAESGYDEDQNSVIIFGEDYDDLANSFATALGIDRDKFEEFDIPKLNM